MILAAGLSPAWQQILSFEGFVPGAVNRASEAVWCASGKVLNVAKALRALQTDVVTVSPQGGDSGRRVVDEFRDLGIPTRWVETAGPTRVCTTILDRGSGSSTELVENCPAIADAEIASFRECFRRETARADAIVISGSIPTGVPSEIWLDFVQDARGRVILDIRGEELLRTLEAGPFLVKPNREELAATLGRNLDDDGELVRAMRELVVGGAAHVVVTDGPRAVWLMSEEQTVRLQPPQIDVVNPIGSGDCLAAGMAWGLERGERLIEAVRLGIAAATENARQLMPADIDSRSVLANAESVTLTPWPDPV